MNDLPQDILLIFLFGLPGLFIMHLVNSFTSFPKKEKEDWKKIIVFSTFSIYILHVFTIFLNKFWPEKFKILQLSLEALSSTYNGFPVLLLILLVSMIISFIIIISLNNKIIEKFYSKIRKKFKLNPESFSSVWVEEISNSKSVFIRVIYQDRFEIGILKRSSNTKKRELYLYSSAIFVKRKKKINELLNIMTPEGIFIDLENSYQIEIYDKDELISKIKSNK